MYGPHQLAFDAVVEEQPVDVEAFVDDRKLAVEEARRLSGKRQRLHVAGDDDMRTPDARQASLQCQARLDHRADALGETTVRRPAEHDRLHTRLAFQKIASAQEAGNRYLCAPGLEGQDASPDGSIGEIMRKV